MTTNMNMSGTVNGRSITAETYFVLYGDHDSGSESTGFMIREGFALADRTASILSECGYRRIEIKNAMDMLNG